MALAAIIKQDVFENLSDSLKSEYKKQDDGTFILDVTPINGFSLEDVTGLKSALSTERSSREDAEKRLKTFDGIDPTKAKSALSKIEEMANWKPEDKVKEQIEAITNQLTEKYQGELGKKEGQLGKLTGQLEKVMVEANAIKAIAENKGSAALLLPLIKSATRMRQTESGEFIAEVVDSTGNVRISPATGSTAPMTIAELVAEMKTQEAYAPAFEGTGASGSGAGSGGKGGYSGNNPFAKKTLNLTEQMKLTKENPALANKLKAEAAGE